MVKIDLKHCGNALHSTTDCFVQDVFNGVFDKFSHKWLGHWTCRARFRRNPNWSHFERWSSATKPSTGSAHTTHICVASRKGSDIILSKVSSYRKQLVG